jgi:site-specific DNA recombinase
MSKVAAIYARVATREQLNNSIEDQIIQLKLYLHKMGYTRIEVFTDNGYSGMNINRPGLNRLIGDLNRFEAIAVSNIDRISRNHSDVMVLINNYLKPSNKKLLISAGNVDSSNPNGICFYLYLTPFPNMKGQK